MRVAKLLYTVGEGLEYQALPVKAYPQAHDGQREREGGDEN